MDPKLVAEKQKHEIKAIAALYGCSQKVVREVKDFLENTRSRKRIYTELEIRGYIKRKKKTK